MSCALKILLLTAGLLIQAIVFEITCNVSITILDTTTTVTNLSKISFKECLGWKLVADTLC